jgi:hypothetical protein
VQRRGPGLAKATAPPFVLSKQLTVSHASDARWREAFEAADAVSEGAVRVEAGGRVWYGSSSFILTLRARDDARARIWLAEIAGRSIHVRTRAIRAACREASLRAPGALGEVTCETKISVDPRGVRIDVDVQATLIERSVGAGSSAR